MFKEGDIVRIVSMEGVSTYTSVFSYGYIGEITELHNDEVAKLDNKFGGFVNLNDVELYKE